MVNRDSFIIFPYHPGHTISALSIRETGTLEGLSSTVYIGMRQVKSVDNTKFLSGNQCRTETTANRDLTFPNYTAYSQASCLNEYAYTFYADKCGCIKRKLYTPRDSSQ